MIAALQDRQTTLCARPSGLALDRLAVNGDGALLDRDDSGQRFKQRRLAPTVRGMQHGQTAVVKRQRQALEAAVFADLADNGVRPRRTTTSFSSKAGGLGVAIGLTIRYRQRRPAGQVDVAHGAAGTGHVSIHFVKSPLSASGVML